MPTVPRYGIANTQTVNPTIRVQETSAIENFGGGAALSNLTTQAAGFASEVKKRADDLAVLEAERKMNERENEMLYGQGETDPATGEVKNKGLVYLKGKDAFNAPKIAEERFSKANADIYNSLSNPAQKAMFEQRAMQRKAQLDRSINRHVSNEIQRYEDETTKSYLESEQQAAVKNYQDPGRVAQSIYNQKKTILSYADKNGINPETTKLQLETAESKTHAEVISRMIANGDDLGAEAYYAKVKENISGAHIESVDKEIEISSLRGSSQRAVDDYTRKGMSEQQAYAQAAKIESPRLREETEQRVARVYNQREQARRQYEQQAVDRLTSEFDKTGEYPASATKIIAGLSDEAKKSLATYRNINPLRDDGEQYTRLKQLAENPATREKFLNHDIWKEKPNLSKEHYENLLKTQADLKTGKGVKELDGAFSDGQVIQNVYESAGMSTKNKEDYAKFKNAVDQEVIKYKSDHGKSLINNNDLRKIAKDLTVKEITEKGLFWDSTKPKYLIEPATTNSVADIPTETKDQVTAKLKSKKIPVTDENLLYYYNRMSGK